MQEQKAVAAASNQQPDLSQYMKFAECSKLLGVRFQQVYQRAVVRGKMQWIESGKSKYVLKADVSAWQKVREIYFADSK